MEGVHFDIHRIDVEHGAGGVAGPQDRYQPRCFGGIDIADVGAEAAELGDQGLPGGRLVGAGDQQHAARPQQRVVGKARRRIEIVRLAAGGQRPDRTIAVGLGVRSGGAAGRVVAGLALLLEQHHAAQPSQLAACRGAGHAGADDEEIDGVHAG